MGRFVVAPKLVPPRPRVHWMSLIGSDYAGLCFVPFVVSQLSGSRVKPNLNYPFYALITICLLDAFFAVNTLTHPHAWFHFNDLC
jgi:hypothetical protein